MGAYKTPLPVRVEAVPDFARILNRQVEDTEEVRYDLPPPAGLPNGSAYLGVAPDATLASAAKWVVVRVYFDASGQPSRVRIRKDVAWDERAQPANWP